MRCPFQKSILQTQVSGIVGVVIRLYKAILEFSIAAKNNVNNALLDS